MFCLEAAELGTSYEYEVMVEVVKAAQTATEKAAVSRTAPLRLVMCTVRAGSIYSEERSTDISPEALRVNQAGLNKDPDFWTSKVKGHLVEEAVVT